MPAKLVFIGWTYSSLQNELLSIFKRRFMPEGSLNSWNTCVHRNLREVSACKMSYWSKYIQATVVSCETFTQCLSWNIRYACLSNSGLLRRTWPLCWPATQVPSAPCAADCIKRCSAKRAEQGSGTNSSFPSAHKWYANILQTLCKVNAKSKAWQNGGKHVLLQSSSWVNEFLSS